jgi:heavy metal sensor kinase
LSVRVRLTLWYGGVLAVILLALGGAVYLMLGHALLGRIDDLLDREFHEVEERLEEGAAVETLACGCHDHHGHSALRVRDARGQVLAESRELSGADLPWPADRDGGGQPTYHFGTAPAGGRYRVKSGKLASDQGELWVQVAAPLDGYDHELAELRAVLLTLLPAGLLLAVAGGYWLAGRALAPVQRMTETARRISAQNLRERIPSANREDELGRLAETLNSMIGRLERSFDAMRQFTADASHELRTPLTAMRTEVEIALRNARTPDDYQQVLASVLEEVERIAKLADSLLLLSREDAGAAPAVRRPVRLDDLVREVAGHAKAVAEQAGVALTVGELPVATVDGDPDRLRQVFFNLFDNAVKYNRAGGTVTVRGHRAGRHVAIEVRDTGVGIPADELPRVFDRFYRVDKSRSRRMGGAGLGLSIVKALVEGHGGRVEVESTPGEGSTFRVVLPVHVPERREPHAQCTSG